MIDARSEIDKLKDALEFYNIKAEKDEIERFKSSYYQRLLNAIIKTKSLTKSRLPLPWASGPMMYNEFIAKNKGQL